MFDSASAMAPDPATWARRGVSWEASRYSRVACRHYGGAPPDEHRRHGIGEAPVATLEPGLGVGSIELWS